MCAVQNSEEPCRTICLNLTAAYWSISGKETVIEIQSPKPWDIIHSSSERMAPVWADEWAVPKFLMGELLRGVTSALMGYKVSRCAGSNAVNIYLSWTEQDCNPYINSLLLGDIYVIMVNIQPSIVLIQESGFSQKGQGKPIWCRTHTYAHFRMLFHCNRCCTSAKYLKYQECSWTC